MNMKPTKVSNFRSPYTLGDSSLFKVGEAFVLVISYEAVITRPTPTLSGRTSIETLYYLSDERGNIVNRVPLKVSKKIEDHQKTVGEAFDVLFTLPLG